MRGRLTLAVIVGVIAYVLCSIIVATAQASAPQIESREPVPVLTTCGNADGSPWNDKLDGYVPLTGPHAWQIFLNPYVCKALEDGPKAPRFAEAVASLYHEWVHAFLRDLNEGDTECTSLFFLRYELRHAWGLSKKRAQAIYAEAWGVHAERAKEFPAYKGDCTFPQADPVR